MGAQSSKTKEQQYLNLASEVSSYEVACREDPFVQYYDSKLQQSTTQFIDTFVNGSARDGPLSLNSVKELTGCFVNTTQEVAELLLQFKLDILKNDDMYDLVIDYLDYSYQIVQVCNALQKCLKHARLSHSKIQVAIEQFEEEQKERVDGKRKTYSKTLKLLENFKTTGSPFTEEFSSMLTSVYEMQKSMLEKVREKKKKLDKKLKSMNTWRIVSNVIFGATCASVLICSFVAAAIAAPPFVAVLGAVTAAGLGSMGGWMNSLWMSYEKEVKGRLDITSSINFWILIGKADLENIRAVVDKLKNEFESLLENAVFAVTEDAAVRQTMEEMKKELSGFMKTIQELSEHTETCRANVMNGRKEILEKIINNRN
ncbi:UPF0496 protein At4g34320-like [Cornus florida]|uniref:UPF0496 protein At4g34320-like n=1 Tax=Cornus florida TaxID=4283 RepID=UPI002896B190|nr:UPF0496 protein At4g34320-like [Cornus florida]